MSMTLNAVSLIVATIAAGPTVEVRQLSGEMLNGTLAELNADSIAIESDDGTTATLATSDVLGITPRIDTSSPIQGRSSSDTDAKQLRIVLADGSRLHGTKITVDGSEVSIAGDTDEITWKLPTKSLASIRFVPPSPKIDEQWNEIVAASHSTDILVVNKGDSLDFLEGVLGKVTDATVQFTLDGDELAVKRNKVAGLIYFRAASTETMETVCQVRGRDGLLLMASDVTLRDDALHVTTASGMQIDVPWNEVRHVDFSQGKLVYLSDLEPETQQWTPYFEAQQLPASTVNYYMPRRDQAFDGEPLRLAGQTYTRGMAIRSRTELVYRLPGNYRRFVALAGIDDRMRPQGHVQLQVYADDRLLLDREIAGNEEPLPIDLDLTGATRLRLVVDFGQDLDISDHFDLCDARIVK